MTLMMYLVYESEHARLWRRQGQRANIPDIWIPNSACRSVVKHPAREGELQLCELDVEEWFARKIDL